MRLAALAALPAACGPKSGEGETTGKPDACSGLGCQIVDCAASGRPSTTVSGTVFAPNGTLPLYGVTVYVPMRDPGPLPSGVQCTSCSTALPGGALVRATTDYMGNFTLRDVPAADDVPIVVQVGKWRRQLTLPTVAACQDTALPPASTSLPRNSAEGDLPRIAITTGNADALECLIRKLGVDDQEISTDNQAGHVHLYAGNGANQFAASHPAAGAMFSNATTLWGSVDKLANYDIALFSCEGGQHPETKPLAALQAVHDFADRGGRVFLSHWHNIWVSGDRTNLATGIPEWQSIATFDFGAAQNETTQLTIIDELAPKGVDFATWLMHVGASTVRDELTVNEPRYTCQAIDAAKAERWVYVDPARSTPQGKTGIQDMLFTTPQSAAKSARCGKVVFSDMHVSSGSTSRAATPFPGGCSAAPLSPQEKALAFIFFDISSCVGLLQ